MCHSMCQAVSLCQVICMSGYPCTKYPCARTSVCQGIHEPVFQVPGLCMPSVFVPGHKCAKTSMSQIFMCQASLHQGIHVPGKLCARESSCARCPSVRHPCARASMCQGARCTRSFCARRFCSGSVPGVRVPGVHVREHLCGRTSMCQAVLMPSVHVPGHLCGRCLCFCVTGCQGVRVSGLSVPLCQGVRVSGLSGPMCQGIPVSGIPVPMFQGVRVSGIPVPMCPWSHVPICSPLNIMTRAPKQRGLAGNAGRSRPAA